MKCELTNDMAQVIRKSVIETLDVMFHTRIQICDNASKTQSTDDFVYCSELMQEDAHAHIRFLFDRKMIEKLVRGLFPPEDIKAPEIYESAAAEIVNIVGNGLKEFLNRNGYHLDMAVPYAPDPERSPAGQPLIQMAFTYNVDKDMGVNLYMRKS